MTPIDPKTPASADPRSPMAPPYVDEDLNLDLVQMGLNAAENETRHAVTEAYETSALLSDDPMESLGDIDFSEDDEEISIAPEISAMHEDLGDDEDYEDDEEE